MTDVSTTCSCAEAILQSVKMALKMASAQVVETSVTNNSPSQDSNHPDDLFQSRYVTAGFKPFSYDNNHSKRSINRKRLTTIFDSKEKEKAFSS